MSDVADDIRALWNEIYQLRSISTPYYAENTYTPTYLGNTTPGATTYTTQAGFYTGIGRVVFFNGRVIWTAATGTGAALISIPSTAVNTGNSYWPVMLRTDGLTFANNNVVGVIDPNTARFSMVSLLTNAAPTVVNVETAGDIIFAGWYVV